MTPAAAVPRAGFPWLRPSKSQWTAARCIAAGVLVHVAVLGALWATVARPRGMTASGAFVAVSMSVAALAGIALLVPTGALRKLRRLASGGSRVGSPCEPWLSDHDWSARGEELRIERVRVAALVVAVVFGVGVMIAIVVGGGWTRHPEAAGFVGLVVGLPASACAWRLREILGRGRVRVGFPRVPYLPGEAAQITFGVGGGGEGVRRLSYSLRRVVERADGFDGAAPRRVETHRLFPRAADLQREVAAGGDVLLVFDLPADIPGTALRAREPSYWVLHVRGHAESEQFLARFLVPIYCVPKTASRANARRVRTVPAPMRR